MDDQSGSTDMRHYVALRFRPFHLGSGGALGRDDPLGRSPAQGMLTGTTIWLAMGV